MRRIADTIVRGISQLWTCERALLRVLQWHTTLVPVMGADSSALTKTLAMCMARAADLAQVLGDARMCYQYIACML